MSRPSLNLYTITLSQVTALECVVADIDEDKAASCWNIGVLLRSNIAGIFRKLVQIRIMWLCYLVTSLASLSTCHVTLQSPQCPWRKTSLLLQLILIKRWWRCGLVEHALGGSLLRQSSVCCKVLEETAGDWKYEDWTKLHLKLFSWPKRLIKLMIPKTRALIRTTTAIGMTTPIGTRDGARRKACQMRTPYLKCATWYHDDLLFDLPPLFQTSPSAALGPMVCWLLRRGPCRLAMVGGKWFITQVQCWFSINSTQFHLLNPVKISRVLR